MRVLFQPPTSNFQHCTLAHRQTHVKLVCYSQRHLPATFDQQNRQAPVRTSFGELLLSRLCYLPVYMGGAFRQYKLAMARLKGTCSVNPRFNQHVFLCLLRHLCWPFRLVLCPATDAPTPLLARTIPGCHQLFPASVAEGKRNVGILHVERLILIVQDRRTIRQRS